MWGGAERSGAEYIIIPCDENLPYSGILLSYSVERRTELMKRFRPRHFPHTLGICVVSELFISSNSNIC